MKIKSPLTDKNETKVLCEAGAEELFCGIEPFAWRKSFKGFCINQRSRGANFTRLKDLEKAISIAHRYKAKVHIAVNAFFYLEEQYKMAEQIIRDVLGIGADGIIFADVVLVQRLNELLEEKDRVIGADAVVLNSCALKFYKRLGATRIVLDRGMTIDEMKELVESERSIEYEVFIIHDLCFFVDGFCTYCKEEVGGIEKKGRGIKKVYFFTTSRIPKRGFGGGCRTTFKQKRIFLKGNKKRDVIRSFSFWDKKHIEGCGACAIYDFKEMGITSLKVLDRNLPTEEKVKATKFIKEARDFLKENISKPDYIDKCKDLFKKTFKVRCNQYDCYYPDALR